MEKIEALLSFLDGDNIDAMESDYDENVFITTDSKEYLVLTDDEADEYTKKDIENFIDEVGINGFTQNFQDYIKQYALDKDFVESLCEEDIEQSVWELDSEELLEELNLENLVDDDTTIEDIESNIDDYREKLIDYKKDTNEFDFDYLANNWGEEEAWDLIQKNNAYDLDEIVSTSISWDGRGHFLARYDGVENEYDEYYIYRVN